jgi:pilus assembly protein CpaF
MDYLKEFRMSTDLKAGSVEMILQEVDKGRVEAISCELEKDLLSLLTEKIKKDSGFFSDNFKDRNECREKIFMFFSELLSCRYPYAVFKIKEELIEKAVSEIFGLGILERYLTDKTITDIFIQDREMIVIKNGVKNYLGEVFKNMDEVNLLIDRIKLGTGKNVDQRIPFLNTELYDGSRCSIIIPPVSDRIYITIRVFNCLDFQLDDQFKLGMFSAETMHLLKKFVHEKQNILIAGSMGSGKTTLLNTLAKLIDKNEIISLIQDTPEIKLSGHPYVRMLTTRPKAREIDNEINQEKLLFETLRLKADRIIVGEVRDSMAAYQMLQALNTGHRGSFGTIHADSAYDALLRIEMFAMEFRSNLSSSIVKKIISRAVDAVIFLECEKDENNNIKNRKISEIAIVDKNLNESGDYKLTRLL